MLDIITLLVTPFQQNCRILAAREQRTALVVDPGGDVRLILDKLKGEGLSCSEIWLTHAHLDHCGGVAELKAATGATLLGHEIERDMRAMVQQQSVMFGLPQVHRLLSFVM